VLLRAAASGWTLRCTKCKRVRTVPAPRQERFVPVPVVVSQGAASASHTLHVPLDGPVAIDDEYDLEGHRLRITALERPDGTRPSSAPGRDIKVLYAVVFDTVRLHYTLNMGETTRSFQEDLPPEEEIHIGSVREVQGVRLAIKTLKSDQNRTLHRGFLLARNVRRVFADLAPEGKRAGQRVRTRSRGAGPWGSKGASNKDRRPRGLGSRRK
jgi:uncharacterized Zn finger protein